MNSEKSRVLIAPIGSGMAMCARKGLVGTDSVEVIVADSDAYTPGLHMTEKSYLLPRIDEPYFFPALEGIITRECIDVFIPCLDPFLIPVAERKESLERLGVRVMISPVETMRLSRDKWQMYLRLDGKASQPVSEIDYEKARSMEYPLFIKPRGGSGSIDSYRIDSDEELAFYFGRIPAPICQAYLPGREYTVDCVTDLRGRLLAASPRTRLKTKAGISVISQTVGNVQLEEMASRIADEIRIEGPFFFQAKEDGNGNPRLIEVNIRLAGTMVLTTEAGINIPMIATRQLLGKPVEPISSPKKGLVLSRYWEETYLSLDDTVTQETLQSC